MSLPDHARFLYRAVDEAERDAIMRLGQKYGAECTATPCSRSSSHFNVVVIMRRGSWRASCEALLPFALELRAWQEQRMLSAYGMLGRRGTIRGNFSG